MLRLLVYNKYSESISQLNEVGLGLTWDIKAYVNYALASSPDDKYIAYAWRFGRQDSKNGFIFVDEM